MTQEELGHVTENDLVFAHQRLEQDLVYLVVGTPIVADDVISDGLDELRVQVVMCALVLQVRVGIRAQSLRVVNLHVRVISSDHIECDQIDDSLLPCANDWVIKVLDASHLIVFDLVKSAFVSHIPLTRQVRHRINLQEDEIGHELANCIQEVID